MFQTSPVGVNVLNVAKNENLSTAQTILGDFVLLCISPEVVKYPTKHNSTDQVY